MTTPARSQSLQSYQSVLYGRAIHPDLFGLKVRRVVTQGDYKLECWLKPGAHLLRFEHAALCACELVTDRDDRLPGEGVVAAFLCAGEHEFEHDFARPGVTYMTSVQTETLTESLFLSTMDELLDDAERNEAMIHRWRDAAGPCLSVLDIQRFSREVHVQAYHLQSLGGLVLRTQTLFERH
jgi:hypothetical protein